MRLTIGMAHFEDYDGVVFTIQSLALNDALADSEIVVVDNSPNTQTGKDLQNFLRNINAARPGTIKYVPLTEAVGTSVPRDRVFKVATGDIVVVMDCHVLLRPGSLTKLVEWFDQHPTSKDLVSGPLLMDGLDNWTTHFDDVWRGEMWGTWGQGWRCRCGKSTFGAIDAPPEKPGVEGQVSPGITKYVTLTWPQEAIKYCIACGTKLPDLPWPGHEAAMELQGYYRLGKSLSRTITEKEDYLTRLNTVREQIIGIGKKSGKDVSKELAGVNAQIDVTRKVLSFVTSNPTITEEESRAPFEIPGMGLGFFACRREAWPGFHPHARGFGGEELYIHEKIRRNGGCNLCLPDVPWWHRFGRPGGIKYPARRYQKVRNYVLEFDELNWPRDKIHENFVGTGEGKISEEDWQYLAEDPVPRERGLSEIPKFDPKRKYGRPQPPAESDLDAIFDWCKGIKRDLEEHLPKLRELASQCDHVTELAKRRESSVALLAGKPSTFVSYNIEFDELYYALHQAVKNELAIEGAVETAGGTPNRHVKQFDLALGADSLAIKPIEPTELLLIDSIHNDDRVYAELLKHGSQVQRWIVFRGTEAFGMVAEGGGRPGLLPGIRKWITEHPEWHFVYEADNQYGLMVLSRDPNEPSIMIEPGYQLQALIEELGLEAPPGCTCKKLMKRMNKLGIAGCRQQRKQIAEEIAANADGWKWSQKILQVAKAAVKAVLTGNALRLNPLDPYGSLVDEAIRRSEVAHQKGE